MHFTYASRIGMAQENGRGDTQYWLEVGSTPGGTDLYNADQGGATSVTVSGLPNASLHRKRHRRLDPHGAQGAQRAPVEVQPLLPVMSPARTVTVPAGQGRGVWLP